jgi:CTP:molybdopterin cytidylyltransferase MocA
MNVRGVILAGGRGTRLGELTRVTNKHLLPVGDCPMVCHALRKLTGAGVRDILLVSGAEDLGAFTALLGSGQRWGCELTYRPQEEPGGIAQALSLAEDFCRGATRCLVLLGDNIFFDPLNLRRYVHNNPTNRTDPSGEATTPPLVRNRSGNPDPAQEQLVNYTWTYDNGSRVESETLNGATTSYGYDDTNQLTSAGMFSYDYDLNGNRDTGYTTTTGNRMTNDGVYTYTWDDEGNLIKKSKGASAETWTFSHE